MPAALHLRRLHPPPAPRDEAGSRLATARIRAAAGAGGLLVLAEDDRDLRALDLPGGAVRWRRTPGPPVHHVALDPGARHLVVGCGDRLLRLSPEDGRTLAAQAVAGGAHAVVVEPAPA